MAGRASSMREVLDALPAVQEAVRSEIAARIAAGELIAGAEGDQITASRPATRDLAARRKELMAQIEAERSAATQSKSAA